MKKALICLLLSLTLVFSTATAVFAIDDVGFSIGKGSEIVKPLIDDVGF